MQKSIANREEVGFGHGQVPVEDFNELAFDPSDVTFAERVGDHRPMDVFQSRVVGVFGGDNESAKENAVESPFFGLDGKIGFGALDVDECNKDVGDGNLSSFDDVRYELGELRVLVGAGDGASARRSWGTKGKLNDLGSLLDYLFN